VRDCASLRPQGGAEDLDLDVPAADSGGDGGSGTGKSVLIKCIIGLMKPDKGSIEIDSHEVTRMRRRAQEIMHSSACCSRAAGF
jgi:phospholipid/cholesterol/gamma-HCH transport system ATP-binding protein